MRDYMDWLTLVYKRMVSNVTIYLIYFSVIHPKNLRGIEAWQPGSAAATTINTTISEV